MSSHATPATHSQSLERGIRALEVLAENPDGMTVSELASAIDTHRAAVYRILRPLEDHHLVRRDNDKRWMLSLGIIQLGAGVSPRLQEVAEPVLRGLAERLGATTALTVRDGNDAVVVAVVTPQEPRLHLTYRPGMRHALTHGAPGHALLAAAPAKPGESKLISQARNNGYAVTSGQLLPGATGVAVAIAAPGHEPEAAISAVWIEGLDPDDAAADVAVAASEIAAALWH